MKYTTSLAPLSKLKPNLNNPRVLKDQKFKQLVKSLEALPSMLDVRPIVVDENWTVLGGNMRLRALQELKVAKVPVTQVTDWTEDQKKEFIIKDNLAFGEWDWDVLANEWDQQDLTDWGLDIPVMTETERLSKLEFENIYYQPEHAPQVKLSDCYDLTKFQAKMQVIDESPITEEQKEALRFMAYRFIRIDFESVANYYAFNATEEEQKVMERLRLVLCDAGLQGFIDDDLLRIHNTIEGWGDD